MKLKIIYRNWYYVFIGKSWFFVFWSLMKGKICGKERKEVRRSYLDICDFILYHIDGGIIFDYLKGKGYEK